MSSWRKWLHNRIPDCSLIEILVFIRCPNVLVALTTNLKRNFMWITWKNILPSMNRRLQIMIRVKLDSNWHSSGSAILMQYQCSVMQCQCNMLTSNIRLCNACAHDDISREGAGAMWCNVVVMLVDFFSCKNLYGFSRFGTDAFPIFE